MPTQSTTGSTPADEVARIRGILDQHLPTVITGLGVVVKAITLVEKPSAEHLAARAAYSAAHWIAKDIAVGGGTPLYDLPSILDLVRTRRDDQALIEELTGDLKDAEKTARDEANDRLRFSDAYDRAKRERDAARAVIIQLRTQHVQLHPPYREECSCGSLGVCQVRTLLWSVPVTSP